MKQIPIAHPTIKSTRADKTERTHRALVREHLLSLLKVLNPADQITYGAMSYEDLVTYARDWLQTEVDESSPGQASEAVEKAAVGALSLD